VEGGNFKGSSRLRLAEVGQRLADRLQQVGRDHGLGQEGVGACA